MVCANPVDARAVVIALVLSGGDLCFEAKLGVAVDDLSHQDSEVLGGVSLSEADLVPEMMSIEENEENPENL